MRKSLIVAAGLALSLAGVASAQQGERGKRDERPRRGDSGQAIEGARGQRGEMGRTPDGLLLKGIELTEGQRAQIAQLNKAQRESMAAKRDGRREEMEQVRAARQRGDTAAVRAAMQKNRQVMEQTRAQHVAAIRNLLTAQQRVQFDRNVAELQQREAGRGQMGARGGRGPGMGKKPMHGHGGR
ncbi:MAG TPA: Spy/CpxP family protein refolding chaperone [Gemmatimonadaceae bacterium]|nr:Spy/CpxP family protein refolding chaperone [Gemmatimonadaceae bacterium]